MEESERLQNLMEPAGSPHTDPVESTETDEPSMEKEVVSVSDVRNMSLPPEMECEALKLKGDAIGDSLYSGRWVLRQLMVLLEFTPEKMSKEVEDELCLLWDMTVGEDVVKFLIKHDFFSIAAQCFKPSTPPRIAEIVVGIIGNMCKTADVRRDLTLHKGLNNALLDLLTSTDPPLLLQLMRLLSTCTWHLNKTNDSVFNDGMSSWLISNEETLNRQLAFILTSSLNDDLLCCTLELIHNLCCVSNGNGSLNVQFATSEMLEGLLEAAQQLIYSLDKDNELKPVWTYDVEKAMEHWAVIFDLYAMSPQGISLLSDSAEEVVKTFTCVLSSLGESESPRILSRHKWQLLGSIANTLHSLGEHNGSAPPCVLPHIIRLLPRLPKRTSGTAHIASFEDEYDEVGDEVMEEFVDVRNNIVRYCIVALNVLDSEDLLEAFHRNPSVNIVELQQMLEKSSDEDFQKIAKLMLNTYVVK